MKKVNFVTVTAPLECKTYLLFKYAQPVTLSEMLTVK